MKIIGTGLSGLVGSRIVELLGAKYEFIDFSLEQGVDITNFSQLKSTFEKYDDVRFLLHLAAFTDVDAAHLQDGDENGPCYKINVIGTQNLINLCGTKGIRLIHISTDFIFDGKKGLKETPYEERDEPNPIEWYGKTKFLAEEEVKKAICPWTILRLSFPFKVKPSKEERKPVKLDLVRKIKERLERKEGVVAFTNQIITPTFIDDFAQILTRVIETEATGVFNAVGSSFVSPFELAQKIAEVFELPTELIKPTLLTESIKSFHRPRQQFMALSNEKVKKELGVFPKTFDRALKDMKAQLILP